MAQQLFLDEENASNRGRGKRTLVKTNIYRPQVEVLMSSSRASFLCPECGGESEEIKTSTKCKKCKLTIGYRAGMGGLILVSRR
mmetsp:Transcript_29831/g.72092  ORF Transcript_29831/g.72092 Transcript_29831/m.72092 type:complete len:84 (-) Transcript_29831:167-418(-)|eukprot:CAMPEP_0181125402 /NCGR_PEP_ID=MMETSP1071-20121207/27028_1 /TAXON_ID=35127 /ORGANISM="Thalassiosira sp., Strain NH16" /LENGTH=83 /DNA_ID=CAMNT_0023210837 /DNA_START=112 /DNA_END=363 /DNA_ORIENTATION=-